MYNYIYISNYESEGQIEIIRKNETWELVGLWFYNSNNSNNI